MTAIRRTEQRSAIMDALSGCDGPVTAQELHGRMHQGGSPVGLATVYRNLQRLAEEGTADTLRRDSGEAAFMLCGSGHHHHLTCRVCGRVEQVHDCGLDRWGERVAREHGFTGVAHQAELTGVCGRCGPRST